MASDIPPVRGSAFSFDFALVSQGDTDIFKTSVTLAAGDVLVSKDGGATAQITSLPTEIGTSGILTVSLSAAEMTADRVTILFHDVAGNEWQDAMVTIYTGGQTLDTIDGNVDSILTDTAEIGAAGAGLTALGDARLANLDAAVSSRNATAPDNASITAIKAKTDNLPASPAPSGEATAALAAYDPPTRLEATADKNAIIAALPAAAPTTAAIDAVLSAAHGAGLWGGGAGTGAIAKTLTIDDGSAPMDGVYVWATTDSAGANVVAAGYTDSLGHVTFWLDAGTYYIWCQLAGYTFSNPSTEVWA